MGSKHGARELAAQKYLPSLHGGYATSSCLTRAAATPKKAHFLMLRYSALGSDGGRMLFAPLRFHIPTSTSGTRVSVFQSSPYVSFPFCCAFQITPPNLAQLLCTWSTESACSSGLCIYISCYQACEETASSSLPVLLGFDDSSPYSREQPLLEHVLCCFSWVFLQ